MIVVAGDALVDMVGDSTFQYQAHAGGSCFNVAMALGRLGHEVGFACPLSSDALGRLLAGTLTESGVRLLIPEPVAYPTPLAVVSLDRSGHPTYAFYRERTADRTITAERLAEVMPEAPELYHIGSLALIEQPDSDHWMAGAAAARDRGAVVSVDPNVRSSLIDDVDDYRRRMGSALAAADIVKLSDEDLAVLTPGVAPVAAFERLVAEHQPALAVLTLGAKGAIGVTGAGTRAEQAAIAPGPIADTIGAGDSLQAGLISALHASGLLNRNALATMGEAHLRRALVAGSLAAGINCTRKGCNPPSKADLDAAMASFS